MSKHAFKTDAAADSSGETELLASSEIVAQPQTPSTLPSQNFWQRNRVRLEGLAVLLLTIGALLLRRKGLATQSLWFDEADLLARARAPLSDILQTFTRPGENGPLYTLFMHVWTSAIGSGPAALRTPSMLAGTAAIPMLYVVGRKLYNGWLGLLAALLLTISPYNVWYSQDAKMYPLVLLLTLASVYLFLTALEKGDKQAGWWVAYVLITTASYYIHLMAVLIVPVEILYYWLAFSNRQMPKAGRRRAWLSMGLLTLPYLPIALWQIVALGSGSLGQTWFQPVGLLDMLNSLSRRFGINRAIPSEPWETLGSLLFAILAIGALIFLWYQYRTTDQKSPIKRLAIFFTLYLLLPVGAFYLLTTRIPLYADRYLLIASPAYYLLVAFALLKLWQARQIWFKLAGGVALLGILALVGVALRTYNYSSEPQKEDWRGAMHWLTQHVEPGDTVFVIPGYLNSAVSYYFKPQTGVDVVTIPGDLLDDHNDADTNAFLLNSVHEHQRAWLVVSPERYAHDEPKELIKKNWFNYNTTLFIDPARFVGVEIYGYSFRQIPGTNLDFYPHTAVTDYNFGGALNLEGYDLMPDGAGPNAGLPSGQVRSNDYLHLTFYWRKLSASSINYQITARLLDANGHDTHTNYTAQPLSGYYPTAGWRPDEAFRDFRDLYIHVPPGQYQVEVSVAAVGSPDMLLKISGNTGEIPGLNTSSVILDKKITVLP